MGSGSGEQAGIREHGAEQRWEPRAGPGSLGASYLPCCPARLLGGPDGPVDLAEGRARLALLWSERAAALRFRRAVLSMSARSAADRIELACLHREAFAYDAAASRVRGVRASRIPWLVGLLRSRSDDPVIGATLATQAAELAVLHLAQHLDGMPEGALHAGRTSTRSA
jgi:hypothetical protein